ncbi:hypothetical protein Tco_1450482 [Tanacetum coccineum]
MSDPHIGRSQTRYVFTSSNTAISWRSVKQTLSATSSNYTKILAIHEASLECVWLRSVIQHIRESCEISSCQEAPTVIHEDNAACIAQLKDGYIKDDRTKHILSKFFFHSLLAEEWSGVISSVLMQRCQRTIRQRYNPCEGPLSLEGHETKDYAPKEPSSNRSLLPLRPFLSSSSSPRKFTSIFGTIRGTRHPNLPKRRRNGNPWGPTEPVLQTQKIHSPSLTIIKENIDVLRTMIKEHDQQAKMKATLRKLDYADSDKEALARQTRSTIKSQKTPSKNKELTHLRRSRRLENQSTTREKGKKRKVQVQKKEVRTLRDGFRLRI